MENQKIILSFENEGQLPDGEFRNALAAKRRTRQVLSELPFEEKYRMLVAIQRRSAAILETRGIKSIVWPDLPDSIRA